MFQKTLHGTDRNAAQCARPLRQIVDEVFQRLVLRFEKFMQIVELRAGYVPVKIARLGIKHKLVGERGVENADDAIALLVVKSDVDCCIISFCHEYLLIRFPSFAKLLHTII